MDELRPFQDPDLSSLQVGSTCLAKQQDGLWYPARITGEAAWGPRSPHCPVAAALSGRPVPTPCPGGARRPQPWPTLCPPSPPTPLLRGR